MHFNKITTVLGMALLAVLAGCTKSYVDPANVAAAKADSIIQAYVKAKGLTLKQGSGGVYYAITTSNPSGKTPADGEEIAYRYVARTLTGSFIDSTLKDTIQYIALGSPDINLGLQEVFRTMRVGETASLFLYNEQPVVNATRTVLLPAYTPYLGNLSIVASRTEDQQIDQYIADKKLTVTEKTTSGLRFIKTQDMPSGAALATGQTVTVKYSGITIHSTKPFDPGAKPYVLTLGKDKVIAGFEEGVRKLRVGEKATIIFPSSLGYGLGQKVQQQDGTYAYIIPPYAPLIFDIEITSAQ